MSEPEVQHFIAEIDGLRAYSKLTASTESGRIERTDATGPWDPINQEDGAPTWFRVSQAVAEAYMADDDEDAER